VTAALCPAPWAGLPELPDHLPNVSRINGLLGRHLQDEGLARDLQVDPRVMTAIGSRTGRLQVTQVGMHLRQFPERVEELGDQLPFG
jgi:hypothetical protein